MISLSYVDIQQDLWAFGRKKSDTLPYSMYIVYSYDSQTVPHPLTPLTQ